MRVENNVPEIRFKGFSGEWAEKLLFEVAEKISVGIATSSSKHFVSLSSGVPFIKNQDIKNGVIDTKNLEAISNEFDNANKNKRLKTGDILTVRTGYPGLCAVLPGSLNNAQSFTTLITRIKSKEVNPFFVSTYINSDSGKRQMNGMQAGGAQQNINANTLKNFAIYYPSLLEEQAQIGNYFQKLDNLINQHQQKHDKLHSIKKAMLEKMFPKQGETIPEIRFKGFGGEWREVALSLVIDVRSGKDYKHLDKGVIPVYGTGGYMLSVDGALSHDEDAIGIGRKGTIDKPYLLRAPFWTVDTLFHAVPYPDFNLDFLFCLFQKIDWKKYDESTGVPSLSKVVINNIPVSVANEKEQAAIGNYFQKLDILINQHQQQITKLNNIKQACLSKMFV